jgi:hypothetical protein
MDRLRINAVGNEKVVVRKMEVDACFPQRKGQGNKMVTMCPRLAS